MQRFTSWKWALSLASTCIWFVPLVSSQTPSGAPVGQHSTPEQLVDMLNGVFGKQQADVRAVHAKGVDLEGVFHPSAAASSISKAPHLQSTSVPIVVRFSNFAGVPTISDADPMASPRGMSIKFHLPDGTESDIVSHSYNGFPAATTDEFRELFIALGTSGPGTPKPTPLDAFLKAHPIAKTFLESQIPPPVSYATVSYFGVNAFKFTNAKGQVTYGRYQIRPDAGNQSLPKDAVAKAEPNYLATEIRDRIKQGPLRFKLFLQIAEKGDDLHDPSVAWPDSRTHVDLGTIEIGKGAANNAAAEHSLLFIPGALPAGIEAEDPMIKARSAAYPVSFQRRNQK